MFDKKKIEEGIRLLLEGIGENPDREGLKDTPDRVARMYEELCSGMNMSPKEHLSQDTHSFRSASLRLRDPHICGYGFHPPSLSLYTVRFLPIPENAAP